MQYIDFKVQHQTITRTDNYEVVGNSENYLYARFEFCAEWDDIIPTAVFSANNGKHISVLIENGECLVPWEMLRVPEFWVGVFGGDRQTTDTARVAVKPGVKFNAKPGVEPTPSAYELLMNELREGITQVEEHAESVAGNAEEAAVSAEDAAASAAVAESSAATADSAKEAVLTALNNVPTGSTVIVNDLTTGGTTAALSAEMGKVLGCRPNPNLLHNWYFANPVNQRGQTEYTVSGYTIDRWRATVSTGGRINVKPTANGVELTNAGTSAFYLRQNFEKPVAGTVTLSCICNSVTGTGYIQTINSDGTYGTAVRLNSGLSSVTYPAGKEVSGVLIQANAGASINIKAVKLELGDTQTLAHQDSSGAWVLNEIPDYNEELLKCCMSKADSSDTYANNAKTPAAINAVSKSGDTMSGSLMFQNAGATGGAVLADGDGMFFGIASRNNIAEAGNARYFQLFNSAGQADVANALRLRDRIDGNYTNYYVLHTGNKPSGTYVGTGDATTQIIDTKGIGKGVLIYGGSMCAIVAPNGCIGWYTANNGAVATVPNTEVSYANGKLTISTTSNLVNYSGLTYAYQVF